MKGSDLGKGALNYLGAWACYKDYNWIPMDFFINLCIGERETRYIEKVTSAQVVGGGGGGADQPTNSGKLVGPPVGW